MTLLKNKTIRIFPISFITRLKKVSNEMLNISINEILSFSYKSDSIITVGFHYILYKYINQLIPK